MNDAIITCINPRHLSFRKCQGLPKPVTIKGSLQNTSIVDTLIQRQSLMFYCCGHILYEKSCKYPQNQSTPNNLSLEQLIIGNTFLAITCSDQLSVRFIFRSNNYSINFHLDQFQFHHSISINNFR